MAAPLTDAGRRRARTRRHVVSGVTLLVLLAFVVGAAWYGWRSLTGAGEDEDQASASAVACPTPLPPDAPPASAVQVNVYNATDRSGLAARAAGQLRERGFTVLDVTNDPTDAAVDGVGQVRAGEAGRALAAVLQAWVPGTTLVVDARAEPIIDLALGPDFTDVAAQPGLPAGGTPLPGCEGAAPAEPAPAG